MPRTASGEEIKSAYRKLALRYHPDKNQGANADEASQKFQIILTAYGMLSASHGMAWLGMWLTPQLICHNQAHAGSSLTPVMLLVQHACLSPTGILSNPDKRRKYDVGGFDSLDTTDREIHVDLSSLGVVSTAVAALFTKLGKTAVPDVHCRPILMSLHCAPLMLTRVSAVSECITVAGCMA